MISDSAIAVALCLLTYQRDLGPVTVCAAGKAWRELELLLAAMDRVNALLGEHPERATLCRSGHDPIIHFSKCPICSPDEGAL